MIPIDISNSIPVRSFSFNLPCREFVIAAQVTRDKRLPVVDEFILRTLNLCESVNIDKLAKFFGFTDNELEIVLADLQSRSLILIEENGVSLHSSGKELFRTTGEGPPMITDVESFPARVWFDLVSKNMIRSRGLHNVKYLINIGLGRTNSDIPETFAREAFQANFRDYLKNTRKIKDADRWGLYAITDVIPGRYSFAQVLGKQSLFLENQPRLETILFENEGDQPSKLRLLNSAMGQALDKLSDPEPTQTGRSDYNRISSRPNIDKFITNDGWFNLRNWLSEEQTNISSDRFSFVGNSFLERNRKGISNLIANSKADIKTNKVWDLFWFRPGGSLWGKSEDLGLLISDLRAEARRTSATEGGVVSHLIGPASISKDLMLQFDKIFDKGYLSKPGNASPTTEIILIPGIILTVSVLVSLSADVNIWIGSASNNPKVLEDAAKKLNLANYLENAQLVWSESKPKKKQINK